MKFLRLTHGDDIEYVSTIAQASERLKLLESVFRSEFRIQEVEISTDKATLIILLNGNNPDTVFTVLKTWHGTARGGLKEELPEARGEAEVS